MPGLRGILRPEEGYAHADLLPEAYDSLAPERISAGTPAQRAERHLCLRLRVVAFALRAAAAGRRQQSGETPRCAGGRDLRRAAARPRHASPAGGGDFRVFGARAKPPAGIVGQLAAMLGSPTRSGREALTDFLAQAGRRTVRWTTTVRRSANPAGRRFGWPAPRAAGGGRGDLLADSLYAQRAGTRGTPEMGRGGLPASGESDSTQSNGQQTSPQRTRPSLQPSPKAKGPWLGVESSDGRVVPAAYQQAESRPQDLVLAGTAPRFPLGQFTLPAPASACVRRLASV